MQQSTIKQDDFSAIRDSIIPLPASSNSDYRRALLLGTTGAGKTTLLRQLIGTDPKTERFPSTSTAKTTVHETEVVLNDGPYRAAVTFFPFDEIREHLDECISEAVLSAYRGDDDDNVLRKLLVHVSQRFNFNYVLGNGSTPDPDEGDDEDKVAEPTDETAADSVIDLQATNVLLRKTPDELRAIAARHRDQIKTEVGGVDEKEDRQAVDELFEEVLDDRLRKDEEFCRISAAIMGEIKRRFSLLTVGTVRRNEQGWPVSWSWETKDRKAFIAEITRFASNHALRFGRLLTPLVNGVRVVGQFLPTWNDGQQPKLVLLDGEGLGHMPTKSDATLSTSLTRRIESTDAIVLVDNAVQPIQAAPEAAIKEMITSGSVNKLLLVFTHFDHVKGSNLPNADAKRRHVMDSAVNVLNSIREKLGSSAERALRRRLTDACFFVGRIDKTLDAAEKHHKPTIEDLKRLLTTIDGIVEKPTPVDAKPVYDRMNIALAVAMAVKRFRDDWQLRLGLNRAKSDIKEEHWARIKALCRRLAGRGDEYGDLKPVADLRKQLQDELYKLLQKPLRWNPTEPTDDEHKQQVFDGLANALLAKIQDLASRRIHIERKSDWQSARDLSGRGSSKKRASIIDEHIYERAAPIPRGTPSPDENAFLREVVETVKSVCDEVGAQLV